MKRAIFILALFMFSTIAAAGSMELTSARLYKKQGEWLKAMDFYNQNLEKDPSSLEGWFERGELEGMIALDSSKFDLADVIASEAENPQLELFHRMLSDFREAGISRTEKDAGIVRKLKKKIDGFLSDAWDTFYFTAVRVDSLHQQAIESGTTPQDAHPLADRALTDLEIAILLLPDKWNAYGLKAQILDRLGETESAVEAWRKALTVIQSKEPTKKEQETYDQALRVIRSRLLQDLFNTEHYEETCIIADEILERDSTVFDAIQYKAFAIARLANREGISEEERTRLKQEAIEALQRARELNPEDEIIIFYIGQFNLQLGDTLGAITEFNNYLAIDSTDKDVLFALGVLYLEGGRFENTEKARDVFKKMTELYPENSAAWINYGIAEIRLGQTAIGREAVERGQALEGATE